MKRIALGVLLAALAGAVAYFGLDFTSRNGTSSMLDPDDPEKVALGADIYTEHCASCHGVDLQGEPNWREELPEGGVPAPPHDETGHTWHHDDQLLFDYTKKGGEAVVGSRFKSNMPGFGDRLSDDEIWAVLSFIKSQWPEEVREMHDQRNAAMRGS